jgi:hypothetical protein
MIAKAIWLPAAVIMMIAGTVSATLRSFPHKRDREPNFERQIAFARPLDAAFAWR